MEGKERKTSNHKVSASFKVGAVSLAFLIIGYQASLFIHSAAVTHIVSRHDHPDTVFVFDKALAMELLEDHPEAVRNTPAEKASQSGIAVRHPSQHSETAKAITEKYARRQVESFPFNPNTAGLEELERLGFSEKQAQSIINYRESGGKFRRSSDFARSFVVADSVYKRLEPFIRIPKVDLNAADSAAFDSLPGIGAYFAARMVSYREELRGYSYPEQLMDIHNFGRERYDGLKDLITVSEPVPYPLWSLSEEELKKHPYIGSYAAHGVVVFRQNNPPEELTIKNLAGAGVLKPDSAEKLSKCRIAEP